MAMLDMLIVGFVLIALALIIWAGIEKKSIKEVIMEILDIIKEQGKQ